MTITIKSTPTTTTKRVMDLVSGVYSGVLEFTGECHLGPFMVIECKGSGSLVVVCQLSTMKPWMFYSTTSFIDRVVIKDCEKLHIEISK